MDLVNHLTEKAHYYLDPPRPEELAWVAANIREHAAEKVGPMPLEVRVFLAEFGRDRSDPPGS